MVALLSALGGLGLGTWFKAYLEHKRGTRKDTDEVPMGLVQRLTERVETVEASAAQERRVCDASLAVMRRRINNLSSNFDGLLMIVELAPEKASEFVARPKERRTQQGATEAAERAAVLAATVAGPAPKSEEAA